MFTLDKTGYGYSKTLCESAVSWFMNRYLPRHNISLNVHHCGLKKQNIYGWCIIDDVTYRPRTFIIEIQSNLDKVEYLKTLFHELQHLLQYVRGDLKCHKGTLLWKGTSCPAFENLPEWEVDAYKKQESLYQDYLTYLKNT